jgi:FKBP-type peptidyl-prolyl cis-trans isomerase FkpA
MRLSVIYSTAAAAWIFVACGGGGGVQQSEEEKNLYALGLSLAERLGPFKGHITAEELEPVTRGLLDIAREKEPAVNLGEYLPKVGDLAEKMRVRMQKAYMEQAALEPGARRLPSGIVFQEIKKGTGQQPGTKDSILVRYRGMLMDGTVFDDYYDEPLGYSLTYATFGFTKAIKEMREGGKARFLVPPGMGYKDKQAGIVPPNSLLIYEVELLKVEGKYVLPWQREQQAAKKAD